MGFYHEVDTLLPLFYKQENTGEVANKWQSLM